MPRSRRRLESPRGPSPAPLLAEGGLPLALGLALALLLGTTLGAARAQDTGKKPEASPSPVAPPAGDKKPADGTNGGDKKPDDKKPDDKKPDDKKPADKKPADDTKPAPQASPEAVSDDLARILKRFDAAKEPVRSLERAYARTLYYHLARDLDRVVSCFHPDFEFHQASGEVTKVPLEELRALLKKGYDSTPPTKLTLEEMLDFAHIRVYSKQEAHDSKDEGWHKEPSDISLVMGDDDRLVIAPVRTVAQGEKPTAFDSEVFYVFRLDGTAWKIVLAE